MKDPNAQACEMFLNIFTLMHFGYFGDAAKELEDIVKSDLEFLPEQTRKHTQKVADLVLNWVAEIKQESTNV